MRQRRSLHAGSGFTYLTVLFAVAAIGVGLAGFGEIWSRARQREKEQELLWVGNQFREAIGLYYQRTPGAAKRYPEKLDDLLLDRRYLNVQRHLRRMYADPMTGDRAWGLVTAPGGGIMGVYSLSPGNPVKAAGFRTADPGFAKGTKYSDWRFIYEPLAAPGAAANPGLSRQP